MVKAIYPENATKEETEEISRKVRDLVNYIANYDEPKFNEQFSEIENPGGVLILVSEEKEFERGVSISTSMTTIGSFNPLVVATVVREWLEKSVKEAILGEEIK